MFTASYTITQDSDIFVLTVNDTSSYVSEPQNTFSSRRLYFYKSDGTTLVPTGTSTTYVDFPFSGGNSIEVNILNRDYALTVVMQLTSLDPQPDSNYIASNVYGFTNYTMQFLYGLLQNIVAQPNITNDLNYDANRALLQQLVDDADNAVYYQDVKSAQFALDQAYNIMQKQNFYF